MSRATELIEIRLNDLKSQILECETKITNLKNELSSVENKLLNRKTEMAELKTTLDYLNRVNGD
jgi:chromosome segregation ATPase